MNAKSANKIATKPNQACHSPASEPSCWSPDTTEAAELYLSTEPLAFCEHTKTFFTRNKDSVYWHQITENKLMRTVAAYLSKEATKHNPQHLRKVKTETYLKATIRHLRLTATYWNPVVQDGLILVKNGVMDLTSSKPVFRQHDLTVHALGGLDLDYSADAKCPDFLAFLDSGLAAADIDLLQQYCGGLLLGRNRYQAILLLTGTSGAGKGTLVDILSRLVGRGNVGELRTNKLEERFEISSFAGRKLLVAPETPRDIFSDKGCRQLKALVGGDWMNPEAKHKQERDEIKGDFHVILHTNSIQQQPWNPDLAAFQRRLLIVTYDKPAPSTLIPDLAETLWAKESSGIFNWGVEGVVKLQRDNRFTLTNEQQQRFELVMSSKQRAPNDKPSHTLPKITILRTAFRWVQQFWTRLTKQPTNKS